MEEKITMIRGISESRSIAEVVQLFFFLDPNYLFLQFFIQITLNVFDLKG
jgi:hypothetical protein